MKVATTLMRWLAFTVMVALAIVRLVGSKPASPPTSSVGGLPNLFGVCVYRYNTQYLKLVWVLALQCEYCSVAASCVTTLCQA